MTHLRDSEKLDDNFDEDSLGCDPGTIVAFCRPQYVCPFCGASLKLLNFIGVASDFYAVRGDQTLVRFFLSYDGTVPPCGCWPGDWPGLWMDRPEPLILIESIQEFFTEVGLDPGFVQ